MIHVVRSRIILPERIRRKLEAEDEQKSYNRGMRFFAAIIGVPLGLATGTVLWACGGLLVGALFGLIIAGVTVMGIYAWLPLIFGGTRIPSPWRQ